MGPVAYHAYCPGCDDEHSLVFLSFPLPIDHLGNSASTILLENPLQVIQVSTLSDYTGSTLRDPTVRHLRLHSLYGILLCFSTYFQSPNFAVTKLGSFHLSYSITHLFS